MLRLTEKSSCTMHGSNLDLRVGGLPFARETRNAVPDAVIRHHVRLCMKRDLPELATVPVHDRTMAVAGSGPSLAVLPPCYADAATPYDIFAVGGAHDWLIDKGVIPAAWINADPMPMIGEYLKRPHKDVAYWVASHSHPFVFEALQGFDVRVWHDEVWAGTADVVRECRKNQEHILVYGGSSGATRAPFIGYELGYRKFRFYGCDGSGGYLARQLTHGQEVEVECRGRKFRAPVGMVHQAKQFAGIRELLKDCEFEVLGDGLTAWLLAEMKEKT